MAFIEPAHLKMGGINDKIASGILSRVTQRRSFIAILTRGIAGKAEAIFASFHEASRLLRHLRPLYAPFAIAACRGEGSAATASHY